MSKQLPGSSRLWRAVARLGRQLAQAATLLALLVVIVAVASLLGSRLLGYGTYVIHGGSMAPAIPVGSLVVAEPADRDDVEIGDIVVFQSPSNSVRVTHRVVDVVQEGGSRHLRTKGDASPGDDPLQLGPSVRVSRVVFHVPYLGYLVNFAGKPLGILLFVVTPAVLLAVIALAGRREDREAIGEA